ncbi:MAG: ATP-binding protein [Chloroflexota bacterium]
MNQPTMETILEPPKEGWLDDDESKQPPAWRWSRADLLAGSWFCGQCETCEGTGIVNLRDQNATCPWCKGQIEMNLHNAGGIQSWQRYDETDLATFDWSRIGAQSADMIQCYAEWMDDSIGNGCGLVITGSTGTGKTHLAVGLGVVALGMGYEVYATMLGEVLLTIRASWGEYLPGRTDEAKLTEKLCTIKLLILDDLGSEKPTEWAIERLAYIINRRYTAQLPTIITTNLDISELETLWSSRVTSRLLGTAQLIELHDVKDYRRK